MDSPTFRPPTPRSTPSLRFCELQLCIKSLHLLVCGVGGVMQLSQKWLKMVADVGANSLSLAIKPAKTDALWHVCL